MPFERGTLDGTLVVGSDGLFDYAKVEALGAIARGPSLHTSASALVAAVRTPTGD